MVASSTTWARPVVSCEKKPPRPGRRTGTRRLARSDADGARVSAGHLSGDRRAPVLPATGRTGAVSPSPGASAGEILVREQPEGDLQHVLILCHLTCGW